MDIKFSSYSIDYLVVLLLLASLYLGIISKLIKIRFNSWREVLVKFRSKFLTLLLRGLVDRASRLFFSVFRRTLTFENTNSLVMSNEVGAYFSKVLFKSPRNEYCLGILSLSCTRSISLVIGCLLAILLQIVKMGEVKLAIN